MQDLTLGVSAVASRLLLAAILCLALAKTSVVWGDEPRAGALEVRLKQTEGKWQVIRGGVPYRIQGAGGPGPLKLLAECGGNSTRMWGVDDNTGKRLDEAHRHGISVALGIWLEHERKGFNYNDAEQVSAQTERVMEAVRRYKNHPAVLLWGIGNEMEGYKSGDNPAIWSHVEDICQRIKREDPTHPTMSVIAEIGGNRIKAIHQHCPNLDIIGINSYGGAATLPRRYRAAGGLKPYIVAEFGPPGAWETERNNIGAAVESSSNEKARHYVKTWESLSQDRELCLGSYAFLWGHKLEATATWFGLLLEDGRKTNAVDDLTRLWTGSDPNNRCPNIESLRVAGANEVKPGSAIEFELAASDPEGGQLTVQWVLLPEADNYITAGDFQPAMKPIADCMVGCDSRSAKLRAPEKPGLYRLYAIVGDGQQAAAVANVPFRVLPTEMRQPGKQDVTCADDCDHR